MIAVEPLWCYRYSLEGFDALESLLMMRVERDMQRTGVRSKLIIGATVGVTSSEKEHLMFDVGHFDKTNSLV